MYSAHTVTAPTNETRVYVCVGNYIYIYIRAVSINAFIYAINLAAINAQKYFNAMNATLFTSGVVEVVSLL